jgi:hypothetical protein
MVRSDFQSDLVKLLCILSLAIQPNRLTPHSTHILLSMHIITIPRPERPENLKRSFVAVNVHQLADRTPDFAR